MLNLGLKFDKPVIKTPSDLSRSLSEAGGKVFLQEVLTYVDEGRSFHSHTRKLRHSIHLEMVGNEARIVAGSPYAAFVEEGTRPHLIEPKNAKVLYIPGIGFRAYAKHPGSRPFPYLNADMDRRINLVRQAMTNKLSQIMQ